MCAVSFRLFSHKPLRSLVLSVAGGSLLTVGCMQNPRSMVARDLSADGKKKSAPAVAGRTTNPFARAGSGAPAAAGPKSQGVFASFFGSKTTDTDGAVDPFLEAETAIAQSKGNDRTSVIVIDTDPLITTKEGGHWWDVAVPEVSPRSEVNKAREAYVKALEAQRIG